MLAALTGFVAAAVVATFVEYWGHRLMHMGSVLRKKHAGHHQRGTGQGWLREFRDYVVPSMSIAWIGFLHSIPAGIGFLSGAVLYGAWAAYSHQLQHERPNQVFWMVQPVHAVHHYHREWHHNFGITTDVWDRVFGTFRRHPPIEAFADLDRGQSRLDIHWTSESPPLPTRPRKYQAMRSAE